MNATTRSIAWLSLLVIGSLGALQGSWTGTTTGLASTQDYPTQPVRLIEPFGKGGGVDTIARPIAEKLAELWGQPVTVENHPGAGSTAAPALVAKAPPDGYTLLVNSSAQAYSAALRPNTPYHPLKDFIPIAPLTSQGYVLVAGNTWGITILTELISRAKAKPNALKFGSPGAGSGSHFGTVRFNREAGIRAMHVPDDAIAGAVSSVVAGKTDYLLAPIPLALPDIRSGSLLPLGVSSAQRSPLLPYVPTVAEAGVTGFDYSIWYGVWAPARTPSHVIETVARSIARVLAEPSLREWLLDQGGEPLTMTQPEFERFVVAESESAAQLIKAAGITPQ